MRNLKKVLSLALCLVMLLGMMVVGAGAVETNFPDNNLIGEKYKEAVAVMNALEIFEGSDAQGNLNPSRTLNRAEAAKIMTIVMLGKGGAKGFESTTKSTYFTDMTDPSVSWACGYVDYCASMGIIKGNTATTVNPKGTLKAVDFATMLLRASGIPEADTLEGPNYATHTIAAAGKYGIADATTTDITREAAAKMALEGLFVSPSNKNAYSVTVGTKAYTFDSAADAYFFATSNSLPAGSVKVVPAEDTLATKNFGLTKTTDTDELGLPTTVYTSTNPKAEVVVPDGNTGATVTISGKPASAKKAGIDGFKFAYESASDKATCTKDGGTVTAVEDAITDDTIVVWDTINSYLNANTTAYVYATNKVVSKVIIVTEYLGQVSTVTAGKDGKPDTVKVGGRSFEANGYEKGDYVLYNQGQNDDDEVVVVNPRKCASVVGTLTRATSGDKYTIDGTVYDLNKGLGGAAKTIMQANVGKEMTVWLDGNDKIVAAKTGNAATQADYLFVLGNSGAKDTTSYMQGANKIVEITALNTAGEVDTYNVSKIWDNGDSEYKAVADQATNEWKGKLFSYVDNNGLLEVTDESSTSKGKNEVLAAKATVITYNSSVKAALNSATNFVFATFVKDGTEKTLTEITTNPKTNGITYKDVTVKTGNANIGDGFNSQTAYVVAKGGVALTVFVVKSYVDAATATSDLVYLSDSEDDRSTTTSYEDGKKVVVNTYKVYGPEGEELEMTGVAELGTGVYKYDTDNKLIAPAVTSATALIQTVNKDTVTLVDGETFLNVADAKIGYLGDDADLKKGQKITYVVKEGTKEVTNLWVVEDQALVTGTLTVAMKGEQASKFDVVVTDGEDIYAGAGVKNVVTVTITKKGTGTFNSMAYINVTPKAVGGHATGGFAYHNEGTAWDGDTASVSFSFSLTGTGEKDVMPSLEFEVSATPLCLHANISSVAAKSNATCQEFNYDAHYKCDDCGQLFSDEHGNTPIADKPNKVAGAHNYAQGTDNSGTGGADDSDKCVCQTSGCTAKHSIVDTKNNETGAASPDSKCDTCGRDISSDT